MIDPLATIIGIVIIIGLILDLILFFVSKILNNKELEITAKNNVIEILITLLIFLILWNSIQTIIPEGVCNILNKGILNHNVDCSSNTSRLQYINQTLNKHISYTYFIIASNTTKNVMNSLIKATSRSVLFRMSFNLIQDPSIKYSQEMVDLINDPDLKNFIHNEEELNRVYRATIGNVNPNFFGTFGFQSCNHLSLIQNKLSSLFAIISQQNSILYSLRSIFEISNILIPLFLFVGIVLRTLKISRGVGGFLISFSIALTLLPYITTFLIEMIPIIDRSLNPNNLLSDFQRYLSGFAVNSSNCIDLSLTTFKSKIEYINSDLTSQNSLIVRTTLLFYLTLLSLGLSLLATISITVGINRLLGIEVSPFILSYIARVS
jgi:hypothetical protein